MGLFDNLFKTKPDAADEAVVEAAKRIAEHEKARLSEADKASQASPVARTSIVPTAKPGSVPAPRAYSPRSLGQVVTPARANVATGSPIESQRKFRLPTADSGARPSEILLTVEDVLPRIPTELIAEGPHDLTRELRFKVDDLSADIARGRGAVPLGRIASQVPELFREPIAGDDQRQVRLPLQKLVEQIGLLPINKVSAPHEPAPAPEPEPALPPPPGPGPAVAQEPAPAFVPPLVPSNARISLSLAAVLHTCPRELIVAELPAIPEDDRISFPWAPIEKQIAGGYVEVSSVRFIFALPAYLQGYLEAREGVRVPLPLDEVLRNIPSPAPTPEPVVEIAPAPEPAPEPAAPIEPPETPEMILIRAPEPAAEPEPESLHLPLPVVTHVPPQIAETLPVIEPEPPVIPAEELPAAALSSPPPIFVPPPLLQSGDMLAPEAPTTEPEPEPLPLAPPNVWMQPPPEIAVRPAAQWPPDVAPPPSPMLPVRIIAPPMVRPFVAPPPLFGSGNEETHFEIPSAPIAPPPPPPRPLNLEVARAALGVEREATLADLGAVLTRLPGVSACWLGVRHESGHAGELPPGFDPEAVRDFARQLGGTAGKLGVGRVQHLSVFADDACVSIFVRDETIVCAVHRTRAFLPGVCEKLTAAAVALAQA